MNLAQHSNSVLRYELFVHSQIIKTIALVKVNGSIIIL